MPVAYVYQDSATLTRIAPELLQAQSMDDPIFTIFPIRPGIGYKLRWAIKDTYRGLMGLRGLGGEPTRINRVGDKVYESQPGVYGEFGTIDEEEMTARAAGTPATIDVPVNVSDLVAEIQEQLTTRQIQRMKQLSWLLAVNNTFAIPLPTGGTGGIGHQETYTGQTITVSPLWSSTTTATPLTNLRALQPAYGFGTSNMYNGMAQAWMNTATANYLLGNTNAADLGGRRYVGGATINDLPGINRIFLDQNLPQIMIWDDGYIDETGAFQLYLPTGKVLIVGKRPNGETPGHFQMVRNAMANFEAKPYAFVKDHTKPPIETVPPRIDVHQGFNGGPVVERPSQLITLTVA